METLEIKLPSPISSSTLKVSEFYSYCSGETERRFKDRIADHIGYIRNKRIELPVGEHFNKKGHSVSDLEAIILEKIMKTDPLYRKERERYIIRKFNSYYNGMNRSPGT